MTAQHFLRGANPFLVIAKLGASDASSPVRVWIDADDEITVGIGEYFHAHFDACSLPATPEPKSPAQIAAEAASFIDDYLGDRIVVWVDHSHQRGGAAGVFRTEFPDRSMPASAQRFTWSAASD